MTHAGGCVGVRLARGRVAAVLIEIANGSGSGTANSYWQVRKRGAVQA